jgi:D-sedoheptulose 7-phosphate isomerase
MTPRAPKSFAPDGRQAEGFLQSLVQIQRDVVVTVSRGRPVSLREGFARTIDHMVRACRRGHKLIFIGNGGSAAIASHQAADYLKNGGLESMAFNDASLLTCLGNDCGYEFVFSKPVERFAKAGDILIAISSSGRSPNILNAVRCARARKTGIVTLSGFGGHNPLRRLGDINFYVPVRAYGLVEVSHHALLHAMLREIIYLNPLRMKVDRNQY